MCTVVVDEIGDTYAKEGTIKARVESSRAFPLDNTTNSIIDRRLSALGFDLSTSGERDEWISIRVLSIATTVKLGRNDIRQCH